MTCVLDSNAALVIVPDLGRWLVGGASEEGTAFFAAGVALGLVVAGLPRWSLAGAADFVVSRETDVVRLGWATPARTGGVERVVEGARVVALETGARTVD